MIEATLILMFVLIPAVLAVLLVSILTLKGDL